MKKLSQNDIDAEPIGIVISSGAHDEAKPAFWAYVWGQADEPEVVRRAEPQPA